MILEITFKMRYDGYYSDNAAPAPARRREICRSFTCISPCFIFWRWSNGVKSRSSRSNRFLKRKWEEKGKMVGSFDTKRKGNMVKGGSRNHEASSSSMEEVSESGKDASFNLGVGFSVIYLVRNELNKRKRNKKPSLVASKSSIQETVDPEKLHSEICFGSHRYRREKSLRMDQLEAELEAEFDHLQQYSEDNGPEWSHNLCLEEANDQLYGVSPTELERKLHELLEERQQERIDELESALEYAMQELEEKERELCWWRETARLVARHVPAIPGLFRQVNKQDIYSSEPEFEVRKTGTSLVKNTICAF